MTTTPDGHVVVADISGITVLRLSRPARRNALTKDSLQQLRRILASQASGGVAALVLTGGNDIFSAGFDLDEIGHGLADLDVDSAIKDAVDLIRALPVPVIAAVEGPCVGAAVEIAVACDAVVVSTSGYFQLPATRLGVLYRPDGVAGLVNAVGRRTAMRLLLLNEKIMAVDAVTSGIASHVAEAGAAVETAVDLAHAVTASSREAASATKELINDICGDYMDLSRWEARRKELMVSPSRKEAVAFARQSIRSRSVED